MRAVEIVTVYTGDNACTKCLGWKRIANDNDQTSWKYWAELPSPSNIMVQLGLIYPVICPRCQGSGIEPGTEASDAT